MQSYIHQTTWADREAVCVNEGRPVRFAAFTALNIQTGLCSLYEEENTKQTALFILSINEMVLGGNY